MPRGLLPVDARNPVIIYDDASGDNWMGEYAALLANSGGPPLAGIIVTASSYWPDVMPNVTGWTNMVNAARSSGLKNIPDVTMSDGKPLARPADGQIDSTVPNDSLGAQKILSLSQQLSVPSRPVVVLVGTQLTDVADAYLLDPTVIERVVVVAALGTYPAAGAMNPPMMPAGPMNPSTPNGAMNAPNGELDPWADWIVAQRFQYVQVSSFYDQTGDVTTAELSSLPQNPLGAWMAAKQPNLFTITTASDQVSVLSVALSIESPTFVVAIQRASADTAAAFDPKQGPSLTLDATGNVWIVSQIASPLAASRLWQMLLDPHTFGS